VALTGAGISTDSGIPVAPVLSIDQTELLWNNTIGYLDRTISTPDLGAYLQG